MTATLTAVFARRRTSDVVRAAITPITADRTMSSVPEALSNAGTLGDVAPWNREIQSIVVITAVGGYCSPTMVLTAAGVSSRKAQFAALLVPVLIPAIHILVLDKFWSDFNVDVNKEHCTCSCWDTVFKGRYHPGTRPRGMTAVMRRFRSRFQALMKPVSPSTSTCTSTPRTTRSKYGPSRWCARSRCTSAPKTLSAFASTGNCVTTWCYCLSCRCFRTTTRG